MSVPAEGGTLQGARSTEDLILARRKYDFSDKVIWKEKTYAPFLTILNRRLQKYAVTDPEPKIMQDDYMPIVFTLHNNAGTTTAFEFTNAQGALFQVGDVLMVLATATYSIIAPEYCLVTDVGEDDSGPAGAGYRLITVSRQYGGTASMNIATAANFRVVNEGVSYAEGEGIGEGRDIEVTTKQAYTEILKESYEVTGTLEATDYYGPVDMQYKAKKARMNFMRRWEYKLIFGRMTKRIVNSKPKRTTGGVFEMIIDAAGTQDMGNTCTPVTFNTFSEGWFRLGSERKLALAGPTALTLIDNAFVAQAHVYTKNEELSRKYLIKVTTLETSHGTLDFVREQALADLPSFTSTIFILDLPYLYYIYMKGRDIQILKNVQINDKDTTKNALFGEIGLHRSFETAHNYAYNLD